MILSFHICILHVQKIYDINYFITDNHCKVEAKSDIDVAANARLIENRTSPIQLQSHGFWRWFYWISVNTSNSGLLWFGSSTMLNRQPRFTLHTLKLVSALNHIADRRDRFPHISADPHNLQLSKSIGKKSKGNK